MFDPLCFCSFDLCSGACIHCIEYHVLNDGFVFAVRYYRKLHSELRDIEEKFRPLMQYQSHPIAHDLMLQGFYAQYELRKKILKLKEYRRNGVVSRRGEEITLISLD